MINWKISPSMLDQYKTFKEEKFDESIEDFIKKVKGEFVQTEQMRKGELIHAFLGNPTSVPVTHDGDHRPQAKDALWKSESDQLFEIFNSMPVGTNEVRTKLELEDIRFNMRIDKIDGLIIHEIKTGSRFWGVDYYDSALQWKLYCLGTGAKKIIYHVITSTGKRPWKFKYHTPFDFVPYEGMKREVLSYAREFIDFCIFHKIEEHIKFGANQ